MNAFFTADTHFGAERTRQVHKRPFDSCDDMDKTMIENWNSVVGEKDYVWHIGDFGDYDTVRKLNGRVILICGNYEDTDIEEKFNGDYKSFANHMVSLGFFSVCRKMTYFRDIRLVHSPDDCDKDRFNLFGHIHNTQRVKRYGLNVGVDCNYFTPVSLEAALGMRKAIQKYYDDAVFEGKDVRYLEI